MNFTQISNSLLLELTNYYTFDKFEIILPILLGEDILTMSLINFTVINYAQEFDPYIEIKKQGKIEFVYISRSYAAQLDKYKKQFFDAFCRKPKIAFEYKPGKTIVTSIAQLNYYRWVLNIGLLDFIQNNYDHIKQEYDHKAHNTSRSASASASSAQLKQKNKFITTDSISDSIFQSDEFM